MNPYEPPAQQAATGAAHEFPPSTDLTDHPLYEVVHRMVIWGEKREEVYHRMEVNGLTGEVSDLLYQTAWADRIRTIRSEYSRKLLIGIGLVVAAVITFSVCWFGLRFVPKILLYGCFIALGAGAWKFIDGTSGYLMAANKKGPAFDDA